MTIDLSNHITSVEQLPWLRSLGGIKPDVTKPSVKLASIMSGLPDFGESYDTRAILKAKGIVIPPRMDCNDVIGCCVISAQIKQLRVLEAFEQGLLVPNTDDDTRKRYYAQTGGPDSGLEPVTSLNLWETQGWSLDGNDYKIRTSADLNIANIKEYQASTVWLHGAQLELALPISAQPQFVWQVTDKDNAPGSWGYHQVYALDWYTHKTLGLCLLFESWAMLMSMTVEFYQKYCVLARAIIDCNDSWIKNSPIDETLLMQELNIIQNGVDLVIQPVNFKVTVSNQAQMGENVIVTITRPDKVQVPVNGTTDVHGSVTIPYQPLTVGQYYAVAYISADNDYQSAMSSVIPFTVTNSQVPRTITLEVV